MAVPVKGVPPWIPDSVVANRNALPSKPTPFQADFLKLAGMAGATVTAGEEWQPCSPPAGESADLFYCSGYRSGYYLIHRRHHSCRGTDYCPSLYNPDDPASDHLHLSTRARGSSR